MTDQEVAEELGKLKEQVQGLQHFTVSALVKLGMLCGYTWNVERQSWDALQQRLQPLENDPGLDAQLGDLPVFEEVEDGTSES